MGDRVLVVGGGDRKNEGRARFAFLRTIEKIKKGRIKGRGGGRNKGRKQDRKKVGKIKKGRIKGRKEEKKGKEGREEDKC
jgi:hypothetical protein